MYFHPNATYHFCLNHNLVSDVEKDNIFDPSFPNVLITDAGIFCRPLFASSLLGIIRTLLEQSQYDEMQILGCNALVDFINGQVGHWAKGIKTIKLHKIILEQMFKTHMQHT